MSSQKPVILLDVPMEGLFNILMDKGWKVQTVTKQLGATKEDRDDKKIIDYALKSRCIVVTEDGELISRCKASGIHVVTIEIQEKARIIDNKLREKFL